MDEGPGREFPAADRWRSGDGRGLRPLDRGEARDQPADAARAHADPEPGRAGARQADQAMDLLQARRGPHRGGQAGDCPPGLARPVAALAPRLALCIVRALAPCRDLPARPERLPSNWSTSVGSSTAIRRRKTMSL